MTDLGNRRPLKSRSTNWAKAFAQTLARLGVTPDLISFAGILFAAIGCAALLYSSLVEGPCRAAALIGAGVSIQLRLLCNLLDGMVAVEHAKGSPYGPIWNELPDRIADALFLVGAGYAAVTACDLAPALGWLATALAILTAYVRELGRGLGFDADFCGPMAKPHRMAALTAACAVAAAEPLWNWRGEALVIGLVVITAGTALTAARRTLRLAKALKERGAH
jgi:phosphatidylglycerophosphate synthase